MTDDANAAFWYLFCSLPARTRSAIVLDEAEQLTLDEIAEVLGADQGAIQDLLIEGRRRLHQRPSHIAFDRSHSSSSEPPKALQPRLDAAPADLDTSESGPLHPGQVAVLKAITAPSAGFHTRLHAAVARQLGRPTSLEI